MRYSATTSILLIAAISFAADVSFGNDGSCPCESESETTTSGISTGSGSGVAMPVSYRPTTSGGVRQLSLLAGTSNDLHDYAQATLDEDWFLKPGFGNAVLHLDVPYDADVKIERQFPPGSKGEWLGAAVQSRGRYRHLVLSDMQIGKRERVNVTATRWTTDPTCDAEPATACRSVMAMAGDRRWVTIDDAAFRDTGCANGQANQPAYCVFASLLAPAGAPAIPAPVVPPAPKAGFTYGPAELVAFVAYSTVATKGGIAESFTFARHDDAPKALKITHVLGDEGTPKHDRAVDMDFVLDLKWQFPEDKKAKDPTKFKASITEKMKLGFKYDSKKKEGVAEIPFDKDSALRLKIESVLPTKLSKAYLITTIEMSASFTLPSGAKHTISTPIKIKVEVLK